MKTFTRSTPGTSLDIDGDGVWFALVALRGVRDERSGLWIDGAKAEMIMTSSRSIAISSARFTIRPLTINNLPRSGTPKRTLRGSLRREALARGERGVFLPLNRGRLTYFYSQGKAQLGVVETALLRISSS